MKTFTFIIGLIALFSCGVCFNAANRDGDLIPSVLWPVLFANYLYFMFMVFNKDSFINTGIVKLP